LGASGGVFWGDGGGDLQKKKTLPQSKSPPKSKKGNSKTFPRGTKPGYKKKKKKEEQVKLPLGYFTCKKKPWEGGVGRTPKKKGGKRG